MTQRNVSFLTIPFDVPIAVMKIVKKYKAHLVISPRSFSVDVVARFGSVVLSAELGRVVGPLSQW